MNKQTKLRMIARTAIMVTVSLGILYAMHHFGWFEFSALVDAFARRKRFVCLAILSQFLILIMTLLRYFHIVRAVGVKTPFTQVAASTFVSNGLGMVLSGSLAIIELVRMGLMVGTDKQKKTLAKLTVASLMDRLIGFFVILLFGTVMSSTILFSNSSLSLTHQQHSLLLLLTAFSGSVAFFIMLLPWLARLHLGSRLIGSAARLRLFRFSKFVSEKVHSLEFAVVEGSSRLTYLLVPVMYSMCVALLSCVALFYSSLAIGYEISLMQIMAAFPVIAISQVLPLGIAGVGGQQLIAVAIFSIFSLSPAMVSSASLLWNLILVGVSVVTGAIFAHMSAKQLRNIFAKAR